MGLLQSKRKGLKKPLKFKSRFEKTVAEKMFSANLPFEYEVDSFKFVRETTYTPDWKIAKNVYIETKGYMSPANRGKLLSFKEQHPNVNILILFQDASVKLNKSSTTTYGEWATKHGFTWHDFKKGMPVHWWSKQ